MRETLVRLFVLVVCSISVVSCGATEPSPTASRGEGETGEIETRVMHDVASPEAALSTATRLPLTVAASPPPSPTPTSPHPTPRLEPTLVLVPGSDAVKEERQIGAYTVQLWRNTADDSWNFDNVVTVATGDETLVRIEAVSGLGDLTGEDITGEGHPDVIIERYTGGAHCCFSTIVYDLGPTLTKILESPESNCGGRFEDLDGDAVFEFVTCDDLFAYVYCPYASSPMVKVVLAYEPERGYVPASPRFGHLYAEEVVEHTVVAEGAAAGEWGEWDETTKCAILPLILDYLYIGRGDQAWAEFTRLYNYPDALLFWAEVVHAVTESPLYVAARSSPGVMLPRHYMLQLLTSCGTDWEYVGLLTEGQSPCDAEIPRREIFWLEMQLREIGLLGEAERLAVVPEGCTTDCSLDVVRYSDDARVGSIRLDTTMGFPGEVYRVNGVESVHWRLRGDLTWEQVSP